jgi:hypothetical protein
LLVAHEDLATPVADAALHYKTLQPELLPFISYPYEWSYAQFKEAALLTLRVMKLAVNHGMILKDATPFNVQFHKGKAIFIDTLSFEQHDVSLPWIAYRQFCESFLYPLVLGHYHKENFQQLLTARPEGLSAAFTAPLLPYRSRWRLATWMHVHLPAKMSRKPASSQGKGKGNFSKTRMLQLVEHLEGFIQKLDRRDMSGVWNNYYTETIIGQDYLQEKEKAVRSIIADLSFTTALDLGANDGYFSRILAAVPGSHVVATDLDESCIQRLYLQCAEKNIQNILPLVMQLAYPSPAIGVNNKERSAFLERGRSDMVLALALVHHLFYASNMLFADIADLFASLCKRYLLVEFVPADDEKTQELQQHKPSFARDYNESLFETAMEAHFRILQRKPLQSGRILYLMQPLQS